MFTLTLSQSSINRAKILDIFTDEEKISLSGVRNGIEPVGPQLKNTYFINKIYARGLANVNIWVAVKVLILEMTKLFTWFADSLYEILKNFGRE